MGNKNDRWSQLSMQQRADLIKLYTDNGITSLDTIKKNYNSFDMGGDTDNNDENKNTSTLKQTVRKVKTIIPEILQKAQYEPLPEAVKDVLNGSNITSKDYENNIYQDVAKDTFLFSKKDQKDAFINSGYIEGTPGDYGLVTKAVGNRDLPVYQSAIDDITRDKLTVLGNLPNMFFGNKGELFHAGHYPTALYTDSEGNVYQKAWDLNNYGSDKSGSTGAYSTYDRLKQIGANILDMVGNPVVRTTGFQQISDTMLENLMHSIKDPVLWEKLMNTKAFDAGNVVLNTRIEEAYEDYIFNETVKLAKKEGREPTEEDFENMKLKTPLNVFRDNLGSYYDDQMLFHHYNIFDTKKFATGGDTDGDGNIVLDWIRKQLYDKIDPVGYNKFVDRVKAAILGKGEDRYNKARDDIFATYLKIPKDERHNVEEAKKVSDATYTPTKSSEDSTYHKIELTDKEKDALIYDALRSNANVGDNSRSHVFEQFFGPHQVGRGKDEKGEYVSYYDLWDLDPSSGESKTGDFEFLKSLQELLGAKDMSLGIGEPVEFYDRIYLNDYYGVTPQIDEGDIEGGYLPLAYVEASAGTGSAAQLTGEDYYDSGESSIPTYSKGGKMNKFDTGGNTEEDDTSKKTSNNKAAIKRKIDKTLFFTVAKHLGFTPKQLQKFAYLFGSDEEVSAKGYAGIEDILRILSPDYQPTNPMDDNKMMFLYGNVNGLPPAENTNGKDFSEYLNITYPGENIKSYQGTINPFNEYVIDIRDRKLLEELATKGKNLYVDADAEYNSQDPTTYGYRDDVASYAFKPIIGNNGLMISAADLYDFGPDYNPAKYNPSISKTDSFLGKLESKLLGFVGNPYILRQDNIPIRFIDYNNASKEDISRAEDLKYAIKNGMMSAKEFDDGTDLDKKLAEVLGNEFLEPITVIAEAKKANGGKLNMFDMGGDKDTWYKKLYNWLFNDNDVEETAPQENKYLTNDNYLDEVSKFISTFEEFYPNAYEDTHNGKNIWTVGSGLTYLIDDEGNETKVKKGDTITQEENIKQLNKRLQKNIDYIKSKTQHWDNYPAELKFQLLDAMYNIGAPKVWNPETNYIKAIRQYENEKGWENPEYDLKNIFQHADWNLNNKGWLGIRSRMRRNPQSINIEDFSKIYQNNYRDSLRTAYDLKFQNN